MRIRIPIFIVFLFSCVLTAYLGLVRVTPLPTNRDKIAHLTAFFVLTVLFYWSMDTHRKRAVNITLFVCCLCASIGTELLQHFATGGERKFDVQDIAANLVGSIFATVLCSLYHGRLNERRKRARHDRIRHDAEGGEVQEETVELDTVDSTR